MISRIVPFIFLMVFPTFAGQGWTPMHQETVVLLGDAFFERDYNYGTLETALTQATKGKQIRYRNLGWSGDTPRCESRSYFGPPAEGFARLSAQLKEIKPNTVIVCYGAVDTFAGEAGLTSFVTAYQTLLQMIRESCGATVILVSPPAVSNDFTRWPSLQGHDEKIALYAQAIEKMATEQKLAYADLHGAMKGQSWATVNGVTFTAADYEKIAPLFIKTLGLKAPTTSADKKLNELVLAKNRLLFARWRPQNEIYLFGSRKHEQGQNSIEIPQFDPLIAEKEKIIFESSK